MAGKVEGLRLGKRGWVKDGKGERVRGEKGKGYGWGKREG